MKHFYSEQKGSALISSLFIILILFTLSFVIYSAVIVYANYQACENELQRASIVTADMNTENANVRDLQFDIPADPAVMSFKNSLAQTGWTNDGETWTKTDGGRKLYSLENTDIEVTGKTMQISAVFTMKLPWAAGDLTVIHIPMQIRASILYLD